jgi:hypothetical protein
MQLLLLSMEKKDHERGIMFSGYLHHSMSYNISYYPVW